MATMARPCWRARATASETATRRADVVGISLLHAEGAMLRACVATPYRCDLLPLHLPQLGAASAQPPIEQQQAEHRQRHGTDDSRRADSHHREGGVACAPWCRGQ